MPASGASRSIVVSGLSWSTPEGAIVFDDISLTFGAERTGLVGRNGVGKSTLLRIVAGALEPRSGAVSVGGRLGVLRQSVQPADDETIADLFGVRDALDVLHRAEAGDADGETLAVADWTLVARMEAALARTRLQAAPETRLATLSGGQRTRAALAALVFDAPDFLLLDEPTNNLDREGRDAVIALLGAWRAGAIVVSHDRELLEEMDAIVELTSLGATRYGGGWSSYRARKAVELSAARHDLAEADKRVAEVARTAQMIVERQARRDGAGRRKGAKGDMPKILLGMRKESSETTGADHAHVAARQHVEAAEAAATARERIEVLQPLIVAVPPTGLAAQRVVLRFENVTAGYAPDEPVLSNLSFVIVGPERVAVTGPNGSGKSTLLALVTGRLRPQTGVVQRAVPFAMLDQQVSILDPATSIRENYRRLNASADQNACRAALARFMFRADASSQIVGTLSGGQILRAGLACVLGDAPPSLLILDEPTNHLDIESIEAVEAGLRGYDGALLVVSHDAAFLENIGVTRRIELA